MKTTPAGNRLRKNKKRSLSIPFEGEVEEGKAESSPGKSLLQAPKLPGQLNFLENLRLLGRVAEVEMSWGGRGRGRQGGERKGIEVSGDKRE